MRATPTAEFLEEAKAVEIGECESPESARTLYSHINTLFDTRIPVVLGLTGYGL